MLVAMQYCIVGISIDRWTDRNRTFICPMIHKTIGNKMYNSSTFSIQYRKI